MTRFKLLLVLALFTGTSAALMAQGSELYGMLSRFSADEGALRRKYSIHESEEYYERFAKLYGSWEDQLANVDFDELGAQGQADYVMFANLIRKKSYLLNKSYDSYRQVSHVSEPLEPLYTFIKARRHGAVVDYKQLARDFDTSVEVLEQYTRELKAQPFENWLAADKAKEVVESLGRNLEEAYGFYYGYDPQFTWWMEKPYQKLKGALKEYRAFLAQNYTSGNLKDDGSGIIGKPIGAEEVSKRLAFSFIPYSADELIAGAERQFAYCEQEMLKAAEELGFGKDWKAALEYVKNTYVPAGYQPALIDSLAREAIDFVEERDLITVPDLAKETWRMIMMTPERQKVNPFFTGGEVISISYPTSTMDHDDKLMSMRGNNPNFSTATVHHELIPGHHLQQYMTSRYKPYRHPFNTPFWGEGWALYWEINLWNKGFADTPEERIGMLFWRMHRCARIIFSLSYHLGKMTPRECIDMLVNRVGHEYANAEAEVRRSFTSGYDPLYQIAYMIGGLQFYALQKEMISLGWTEKQYHDAAMKEGSIPIEILRAILKGEPLSKSFRTGWKFAMDFQ